MNKDIIIVPKGELHIHISEVSTTEKPYATIVTSDGELVKKYELNKGENIINISAYLMKNYAVKVGNGKNITVQKI